LIAVINCAIVKLGALSSLFGNKITKVIADYTDQNAQEVLMTPNGITTADQLPDLSQLQLPAQQIQLILLKIEIKQLLGKKQETG